MKVCMKNNIKFFLIVFLSFLFLDGCESGSQKWIKVKYAEGFSLKHPGSWQAQVIDKEYIWVSPGNPAESTPFILVRPFFLSDATDCGSWLRQNISLLQNFFTNVTIDRMEKIQELPNEWAAKFRCHRNELSCEGLALCSIYKKSGILYVVASKEDEFEGQKDQLIKIIESFQFEEPEKKDQKGAARPKIRFTDWQDPLERAFSLQVPEGWAVEGGTFRRASVDLLHVLLAVSPDQQAKIQFNDSSIPIFALPNPTLSMAGFYEGAWYSPGYGVNMLVKRYAPGRLFLAEYVKQNLRPHLANFEIVSEQDRPDVVDNFNRIYSQYMSYGVSFTLHAGELAFSFEQNSDPFVGYGLALTQITQTAGMQGGGNWTVALLTLYTCPASEDESVRQIAEHMFQSVQMNPQWVASQQQLTANVSQIVTHTNQEISNIINNSYWARQNTMDNINRRFSNYILGVNDVVDPVTGETWNVEAGHNYYWRRDYSNEVVGSDVFERPDINFSPLREIR
jgi:hypothetical protein